MKYLFCILLGYLLGTLSPAALLSKLKNKDLRTSGTGNLGATNTMLVMGRIYGVLVMLFDVAKAYFAVILANCIFSTLSFAGLMAGAFAVVGHIFPFYLRFKGGKGLASFGGMVLGADPLVFLFLLFLTVAAMLLVNYGVAMPITAGILFPVLYGIRSGSIWGFAIALFASAVLIGKHVGNIQRVLRGEDTKIREYIKTKLFKKT